MPSLLVLADLDALSAQTQQSLKLIVLIDADWIYIEMDAVLGGFRLGNVNEQQDEWRDDVGWGHDHVTTLVGRVSFPSENVGPEGGKADRVRRIEDHRADLSGHAAILARRQ